MLTPFYEKLHITDTVSVIIVSIALMLICGFAATRVTKRLRLPNVTAYIVAGILIGPYCLHLMPVKKSKQIVKLILTECDDTRYFPVNPRKAHSWPLFLHQGNHPGSASSVQQ